METAITQPVPPNTPAPTTRERVKRTGTPPAELALGQTVIVAARWLLVLVGLLVCLWNPDPLPQLRLQIGVLLTVAIANFAMHAQLLRRRPAIEAIAMCASGLDIFVISLLVASQGGASSDTFVFFFPAVLAIAVAFPTLPALLLSGAAVLAGAVVTGFGAGDVVLERTIALAAVALIGNAYWRLHRSRISTQATAREAEQDLFWGQLATLWARWGLLVGGAVLVLSRARTTEQLAIGILPVVALLVANFYLHGRYLLERPANATLTLLAVVVDVALLAVMLLFAGGSGGASPLFVLLYPLVFAVGLVFTPRISWAFTAVAVAVYSGVALATDAADPKALAVRLIIVAAMGGLGSLYWRMIRRQSRIEVRDESHAALAWQAAHAS